VSDACAHCAAPLAVDQRYCLSCGTRRPGAPSLDALPPLPAPRPDGRSRRRPRVSATAAGTVTAGVLAAGILIGVGIGPVALSTGHPAERSVILVDAGPVARRAPVSPAASAGGALAPPRGEAPSAEQPAVPAPTAAPAVVSPTPAPAPTPPAAPAPAPTPTPPASPPEPKPEPPAPAPVALDGVVVSVNPVTGVFVLADAEGLLSAVHADALPPAGGGLKIQARPLANGTWALDDPLPTSAAPSAPVGVRLQGTVTWVDPLHGAYTMSAPGVSLLVGPAAPAAAPPPAVGDQVEVEATLAPSAEPAAPATLVERARRALPAVEPPWDVTSIVVAVDTARHRLFLSADDAGRGGGALIVDAPAPFDLDALTAGERIVARVRPTTGGGLRLTGIAADTTPKAADDAAGAQGDLATPASNVPPPTR
jgi:hypothetical protein